MVFVEEGKTENPEKNTRNKARSNSNLSPHTGTGLDSYPGHIGGRQVLSALRHPYCPMPFQCSPVVTDIMYVPDMAGCQ